MMNTIKIISLSVVALMTLAACATDPITKPELKEASAQQELIKEQYPTADMKMDMSEIIEYPLWTDRNVLAGEIRVSNDVENIYVTYFLHDDWSMIESRLHVANSPSGIPTDPYGSPLPEQFEYQTSMDRGKRMFTYQIPLRDLELRFGDLLYLASLVEVEPSGDKNLDALDRDSESGIKMPVTFNWWHSGQYLVSTELLGQENAPRVSARLAKDKPANQ